MEATTQESKETRLTATGPRGETYTLVFPAGALPAGITVAMTPLDRVDGFPYSGALVAGVALEPDGLVPFLPGTLTITPQQTLLTPGYEVAGFGYRGDGQGFYPQVAFKDGPTFIMLVSHFSGWGVGTSTDDALLSTVLDHPPDDAMSEAESMAREEGKPWPPPDLNDPADCIRYLNSWGGLVLDSLVGCDSPGGYRQFDGAWVRAATYLTIPHVAELLDPTLLEALRRQLAKCFLDCSGFARQACARDGTVVDLGAMYRWYEYAKLAIASVPGLSKYLSPGQVDVLLSKVIETGKFDLELEANVVQSPGWGLGFKVSARVDSVLLPLRADLTCENTGTIRQTLDVTKNTIDLLEIDETWFFHVGQTQIESTATVRLDPQLFQYAFGPAWSTLPSIITVESKCVEFEGGIMDTPNPVNWPIYGWELLDGVTLENPDVVMGHTATASSGFFAQNGDEYTTYTLTPSWDHMQASEARPCFTASYDPAVDLPEGRASVAEELEIKVYLNGR